MAVAELREVSVCGCAARVWRCGMGDTVLMTRADC
jgi:hypothetical protein